MNISVIVPAYNAAGTIADTLESLLAQNYPNWEAIVVDDGSSDRTAEIARSFEGRDARIRVISQSNAGESAARNSGVALANSDWLLFLDADDWISPVYLSRMTHELSSDQALDAVHCGYVRVASDGTQVVEKYWPPSGDMFGELARRAAFPSHACIVRKALVDEAGGFDTSLRTCPDWDLWQRIARTGARFGAVREVLAFYRMSPNGASLDAYQLLKDGLRVLKQGHSRDPRVQTPHPTHANGMPPEQVQSQEFYLLCWCAGLLLGSAKDARPLLEAVRDDHYTELYPDAIAQCIFESATLPTCHTAPAWENLWPEIRQQVEEFLLALEEQSLTPNLAGRALTELKRMILKHSQGWGPVIEEDEQTITKQQALIEQLGQDRVSREEDRNKWQRLAKELEQEKTSLETILNESRRLSEKLEQEKTSLEDELRKWQRLTKERELIIANLQEETWVRLGLRLRFLKRPDIDKASFDTVSSPKSVKSTYHPANPQNCIEEKDIGDSPYELRVAGGNIADLVFPTSNPEIVRIAIKKTQRRKKWDIQLNQPHLKIKSNRHYTVSFRGRADRPRSIILGVAKAHEPWSGLGLYKRIDLTPEWQSFQEGFLPTADEDNARIHFDLAGSNIAVEVSSVSLCSLPDGQSDQNGARRPKSAKQV